LRSSGKTPKKASVPEKAKHKNQKNKKIKIKKEKLEHYRNGRGGQKPDESEAGRKSRLLRGRLPEQQHERCIYIGTIKRSLYVKIV